MALNLKVSEGQSYSLHSGVRLLDLDTLVLEDGATLKVNNGEAAVMIRAKHVVVGENVSILGSGQDGAAGEDAQAYAQATDCNEPRDGKAGGQGQNGTDGVNLNLDWTIASFGNLTIDLRGGAAGAGGDGANGQDADQNERCSIQRGGDAGAGGASGESGSGGNLSYVFRGLESDEQAFFARENTKVLNDAGAQADSGAPGKPGVGSVGRYVKKKTLSGNRSWSAGGKEGRKASSQAAGLRGQKGSVTFQLATLSTNRPAPSAKTPVKPESKDVEQRLIELEEAVKRLTEQVKRLESAR